MILQKARYRIISPASCFFFAFTDFRILLTFYRNTIADFTLTCYTVYRPKESVKKSCNEAKALKGSLYYEKKQNQYGIGSGNYDGSLHIFGLR